MRWLLALVLSCLSAAAQAEPEAPVDIAIVVALDRSESIDADEAGAQIDGLVYTLRDSHFREAVAAGWHAGIGLAVVTWSSFGRHDVILPWMRIAGADDAEVAASVLELDHDRQRVSRHGTQTDVAFAIEVSMDMLETLPWTAAQSVINVVADGTSNIGRIASVDRNVAVARGITINGLVMARGAAIEVLSRYFRREVIGGPTAFVQVSASNEDFAEAMLRKMLREMVRLRPTRATPAEDAG